MGNVDLDLQIKVDIITSMVLFDDINWGGGGGAQDIFYAILMFKVLLFFSLIAFSACAIVGVKLFVFICGAFFYLFVDGTFFKVLSLYVLYF